MDMPTPAASPQHNPFPPHASLCAPALAHGVRILSGADWLNQVVALHKQVRGELPEHQKNFLLPKTDSYFQDLLLGKTGILFGAFADNKLIGTMALCWATSFEEALGAQSLTAPDPQGRLKKKYGQTPIGIIQSMGICNAYMGRGHSKLMLQAAIRQNELHGNKHLFAQIAEDNTLSWLRFLSQDFAIVKTWTSDHRRYLLRWLPPREKEKRLRKAKPADKHSYAKNYAQLSALLMQMPAKLNAGREVFLDNRQNETGSLNVVFGQTKPALVRALSIFKKRRQRSA